MNEAFLNVSKVTRPQDRWLFRYARLQAVVVSFHKVGEGVQRQSEHSLYTSVVGLEERAGRRRVNSPQNRTVAMAAENPHRFQNMCRWCRGELLAHLDASTDEPWSSGGSISVKIKVLLQGDVISIQEATHPLPRDMTTQFAFPEHKQQSIRIHSPEAGRACSTLPHPVLVRFELKRAFLKGCSSTNNE